jgi:anti-sigma factor RsiW
MSAADGVRCLDDELSEYAAGRLPAPRVRAWERHLAVCDLCAVGLERERRLRAVLAGGPSMPGDLRNTLLAMGRALTEAPAGPTAVPTPTARPLTLLAPSAPACHRSPLRATVVAAAAAGVSAAAAWSLTVIGAPAPARVGFATTPVVRPAGATSGTPGTTVLTARWSPVGSAAVFVRDERAQSTP